MKPTLKEFINASSALADILRATPARQRRHAEALNRWQAAFEGVALDAAPSEDEEPPEPANSYEGDPDYEG